MKNQRNLPKHSSSLNIMRTLLTSEITVTPLISELVCKLPPFLKKNTHIALAFI